MSQENVETVRALSDAFNRGDEKWLGFYSRDAELQMPARLPQDPTLFRGSDGMKRVVAEFEERFSEIRWDRELLIDAGDRVVGLFHRRGRGDDGAEVDEQVAGVFSLRDGEVTRVQGYPSWSAAMKAVEGTE
jgi:ketosteroid isomerase-like protein